MQGIKTVVAQRAKEHDGQIGQVACTFSIKKGIKKASKQIARTQKETVAAQERKFGLRQVESEHKSWPGNNEENNERRSSDTRQLSAPQVN